MSQTTVNTPPVDEKPVSRDWHWHPELPMKLMHPLTLSPAVFWRWLRYSWLSVSTRLLWVIFALAAWHYLAPSLEQMKAFEAGWIAQVYAKNFLTLCIVAGGLQLFLHSTKKQGKQLKFERKDLARNNRVFLFSDQVKDNMFWSLVSGVTIWTAYESIWFWAYANGYVAGLTYGENPIWFLALFVVLPLWASVHFYYIHRLIHWPPLYRAAHALHHRNINIGPWTGISMHPVEHLLYFSNIAIHFVIASHPLHVLFHMFAQGLGPAVSHCGFASLVIKGKAVLPMGDFFHQLHHRYFECNYGTYEMPVDLWTGNYSDGTRGSVEKVRVRKRQIFGEI